MTSIAAPTAGPPLQPRTGLVADGLKAVALPAVLAVGGTMAVSQSFTPPAVITGLFAGAAATGGLATFAGRQAVQALGGGEVASAIGSAAAGGAATLAVLLGGHRFLGESAGVVSMVVGAGAVAGGLAQLT